MLCSQASDLPSSVWILEHPEETLERRVGPRISRGARATLVCILECRVSAGAVIDKVAQRLERVRQLVPGRVRVAERASSGVVVNRVPGGTVLKGLQEVLVK